MRYFITGTAGFIGYHLASHLLDAGHQVTGLDAVTPYYDIDLKRGRLALLEGRPGFAQVEAQLEDAAALAAALRDSGADIVVHLAAQPGVRYSIEHPQTYIQSNIVGTANLLEALRTRRPQHFIFASSSSVYGGNTKFPFAETDRADGPVSLYAATKKAGEAMVHSYAHLWNIPSTCVRFFTVYGPWGRPDMAPMKFARAIAAGDAIDVYGDGRMQRDFTYVGDLVVALAALADRPPVLGQPVAGDSLSAVAPFRVVNAGGGRTIELMDFIAAMEDAMARKAVLNMLPMQPGDVVSTQSDASLLRTLVGHVPETPLSVGLAHFAAWYRDYHHLA